MFYWGVNPKIIISSILDQKRENPKQLFVMPKKWTLSGYETPQFRLSNCTLWKRIPSNQTPHYLACHHLRAKEVDQWWGQARRDRVAGEPLQRNWATLTLQRVQGEQALLAPVAARLWGSQHREWCARTIWRAARPRPHFWWQHHLLPGWLKFWSASTLLASRWTDRWW